MDLEVRMLGRRAGTLWVEQHEGLAFRYDTNYLAAPWAQALGQQLPLQAEPFPAAVAHRWFSGLLPEGERRESVARQLGLHHADTPGLLAAIGAECAGAVEIGRPEERDRRTPRAVPATREAIAEELLTLPAMPLGTPGRSAKLSLAGVQKKLALVRDRSGTWHFPLDGYPSTHIIKPESDRFDALVDNEHTCLEIARRSALRAARSHVETFGTERCLVVERFDRTPTGDRIHQEDFAQALGTRIKYQNEGGPGLHTYFSHLPVHGMADRRRVGTRPDDRLGAGRHRTSVWAGDGTGHRPRAPARPARTRCDGRTGERMGTRPRGTDLAHTRRHRAPV